MLLYDYSVIDNRCRQDVMRIKKTKVGEATAESVKHSTIFLPHFNVFCDLLQKKLLNKARLLIEEKYHIIVSNNFKN